MILNIDFDGVIHDYKNPIPGRFMGKPIDGAREALETLKRQGHTIVVFTVRGAESNKKHIIDFMNYYHLPFDDITNIKKYADIYLDDRGMKFLDWQQALGVIHGL